MKKKLYDAMCNLNAKLFAAKKEEGATMVEYGLMVALIAVVCIAAVTIIGTQLNTLFGTVGTDLTTVNT